MILFWELTWWSLETIRCRIYKSSLLISFRPALLFSVLLLLAWPFINSAEDEIQYLQSQYFSPISLPCIYSAHRRRREKRTTITFEVDSPSPGVCRTQIYWPQIKSISMDFLLILSISQSYRFPTFSFNYSITFSLLLVLNKHTSSFWAFMLCIQPQAEPQMEAKCWLCENFIHVISAAFLKLEILPACSSADKAT